MSDFHLPILKDIHALLLKDGFVESEANALVDILWKELAKIPREDESEKARQAISRRLADYIARHQLGENASAEELKKEQNITIRLSSGS